MEYQVSPFMTTLLGEIARIYSFRYEPLTNYLSCCNLYKYNLPFEKNICVIVFLNENSAWIKWTDADFSSDFISDPKEIMKEIKACLSLAELFPI